MSEPLPYLLLNLLVCFIFVFSFFAYQTLLVALIVRVHFCTTLKCVSNFHSASKHMSLAPVDSNPVTNLLFNSSLCAAFFSLWTLSDPTIAFMISFINSLLHRHRTVSTIQSMQDRHGSSVSMHLSIYSVFNCNSYTDFSALINTAIFEMTFSKVISANFIRSYLCNFFGSNLRTR